MPIPPPCTAPSGWHGVIAEVAPDARVPLGVGRDGPRPTLRWAPGDPGAVVTGVVALGGVAAFAPTPRADLQPGAARPGDSVADGPLTMRLAPSEPWRAASDVLLVGSFGSVLVPSAWGGVTCGSQLARAGIAGEALLTALTATEVLKHAVARPRPYTALDPAAFGEMGALGEWYLGHHVTVVATADGAVATYDADATASFPSGHTASVGAASFALTTIALTSRANRRAADLAWYAVPTALTAVTGYARVRALAHHPTDVIAGGAIGAAAGVLVPLAHLAPTGPVTLVPTGAGLAAVGAW